MKKSKVNSKGGNYRYQVVKRAKLFTERDLESTPVRVTGYQQETLTTDWLAAEICHTCSMTEADVVGVLTALGAVMGRELSCGKRICLDDIGTFGTTLTLKRSSKGGEESEQKTTDDRLRGSQISIGKVTFTPCEKMKKWLRGATFVSAGVSVENATDPAKVEEVLTAFFATYDELHRGQFENLLGVSRRTAYDLLDSLVSEGKLLSHSHNATRFYTAVPGYFAKK